MPTPINPSEYGVSPICPNSIKGLSDRVIPGVSEGSKANCAPSPPKISVFADSFHKSFSCFTAPPYQNLINSL